MARDDSSLGPLASGGSAIIVGGGPAGAATAMALKQCAALLGRDVRVILVEGKRFAGEEHHNKCAGVLSPPIVDLIERDLGVPFPRQLSRVAITGYVLHAGGRTLVLDGATEPSVALRRVQFDAYMLEAARQRGVEIVNARVTDLEFHADRVMVYTEGAPLAGEVVVGAFGLDEGTGAVFQRTVGYRQPPALSSVVTKYHPGAAGMQAFGQRIHAFLPPLGHIEFGAITPKGNHLTINIAGEAVDADLMNRFLAELEVRAALPDLDQAGRFDANDLRFYKGRFPRGLARRIVGDRFVMVGDAAGLVRAFKGKGVTSAIQTGLRAAQVILRVGISERAFQAYLVANQDIITDLPYGQVMRRLTILAARLRMMGLVLRAAEADPGLRRALFDAVSAHRSYQAVVQEGLSPASVRALLAAMVRRSPANG